MEDLDQNARNELAGPGCLHTRSLLVGVGLTASIFAVFLALHGLGQYSASPRSVRRLQLETGDVSSAISVRDVAEILGGSDLAPGLDYPDGEDPPNAVLRAVLDITLEDESPKRWIMSSPAALAQINEALPRAVTRVFRTSGGYMTPLSGRLQLDLRGSVRVVFWLSDAGFCVVPSFTSTDGLFTCPALGQALLDEIRKQGDVPPRAQHLLTSLTK